MLTCGRLRPLASPGSRHLLSRERLAAPNLRGRHFVMQALYVRKAHVDRRANGGSSTLFRCDGISGPNRTPDATAQPYSSAATTDKGCGAWIGWLEAGDCAPEMAAFRGDPLKHRHIHIAEAHRKRQAIGAPRAVSSRRLNNDLRMRDHGG